MKTLVILLDIFVLMVIFFAFLEEFRSESYLISPVIPFVFFTAIVILNLYFVIEGKKGWVDEYIFSKTFFRKQKTLKVILILLLTFVLLAYLLSPVF